MKNPEDIIFNQKTNTSPEVLTSNEKNQTQTQAFLNELPNENGFIDFFQLKKVEYESGTHDVFVFPNNPAFVIKLNRGILEKVLATGQTNLTPEMRQEAEQHVENENSRYDQLYQYFGDANCLHEQMSIQKVKLKLDDKFQQAETLISIQEYSDVFTDPNRKDFSTSYAEKKLTKETQEIYKRMNEALMGNGKFNENDFLEFNDKLKPMFELIESDLNFKKSMQEFLLRFKEYFSASGNFIDLVGDENVLFYQKDGKWAYQLGSVLKAESKQNVEGGLKMLEENPGLLNASKQKSNLMNGLAVTRLLNAVGIKAGIGKIIDIQLSDKQLSNLDKIKFYEEKPESPEVTEKKQATKTDANIRPEENKTAIDKPESLNPMAEMTAQLLEIQKILKEVIPNDKNFDIELEESGVEIKIKLKHKESGEKIDLTSFLPANYSFKKDESFYCSPYKKGGDKKDNGKIGFPEQEKQYRGFVLSLFHEIGHSYEKQPKISTWDSLKAMSEVLYKFVKSISVKKETRRFGEDTKMVYNVTSSLKPGENAIPQWYIDKRSASKASATSERNAWAFALKSLRQLERDGYNVFAGFENVKQIKDFIKFCLFSYDLELISKKIIEKPEIAESEESIKKLLADKPFTKNRPFSK